MERLACSVPVRTSKRHRTHRGGSVVLTVTRPLQDATAEATQAAKNRGHELEQWNYWHGTIATSICKLCGSGVLCQTGPGTIHHMGGTALLRYCPMEKENPSAR